MDIRYILPSTYSNNIIRSLCNVLMITPNRYMNMKYQCVHHSIRRSLFIKRSFHIIEWITLVLLFWNLLIIISLYLLVHDRSRNIQKIKNENSKNKFISTCIFSLRFPNSEKFYKSDFRIFHTHSLWNNNNIINKWNK